MPVESSLGDASLPFRRQFILGPNVPDSLSQWCHYQIKPGLELSVHPDLPFLRVHEDGRALALLGYVLDPRSPEWDDRRIVTEVLRRTSSLSEVQRAFDSLAGRWAAIYLEQDHATVFHDPAAFRQVHYGRDDGGALWIGSRPELLAQVTKRPLDVDSLDSLRNAGVLDAGSTHFWPGSGSAFVGIERLLPNHHLNVGTGDVQRYWPTAAVTHLDPAVAVEKCAELLTGVFSAASIRYPLAFGMTAGHDTRLLLAASRQWSHQISYYTLKKTGMTWLTSDIRIPRRMLPNLGLSHKVIPVKTMSTEPVASVIASTFTPCHQQTADQAAALAGNPPRESDSWVTVNGNVCEIARIPWVKLGDMTIEKMADELHMSASDYAVAQLSQWYETALPAIRGSGMNPWEFFYWEQRLSAWGGMVRTEFDVVEEAVSPYNCRELLECMLGVDLALRRAPDFLFFRQLIHSLWPQLLDYPINPKSKLGNLEHRLRKRLRSVSYRSGNSRVEPRSPTTT